MVLNVNPGKMCSLPERGARERHLVDLLGWFSGRGYEFTGRSKQLQLKPKTSSSLHGWRASWAKGKHRAGFTMSMWGRFPAGLEDGELEKDLESRFGRDVETSRRRLHPSDGVSNFQEEHTPMAAPLRPCDEEDFSVIAPPASGLGLGILPNGMTRPTAGPRNAALAEGLPVLNSLAR
ncbi:hypothetical protein BDK51DRAFT_32952 [Blyttiomyces helicus]|uniref:Uncharacterized protein n=1 Tax=Blyttiomyces helicus TaxID=388810 RepID=A0A4P9WCQ6_9FUNG|nr:hypothetical protein BDK51DRAFT_32952 [Blyttiomyces helicus]|eukprot:RKO90112.1 hypothetical protein BDK51DRAFT_32952 [Blyttiomyces helicus]